MIVEVLDRDALGVHPVFSAFEGRVLADDDARDAVQDGGAGAHRARAECADEGEGVPVSAAAGGLDADGLGVGGGVVVLHAAVVAARDDLARGQGEHGADRDAAFCEGFVGLLERGVEEISAGGRVHRGTVPRRGAGDRLAA